MLCSSVQCCAVQFSAVLCTTLVYSDVLYCVVVCLFGVAVIVIFFFRKKRLFIKVELVKKE